MTDDRNSFCHFCGKTKDKYDPPMPEKYCGNCAEARDKGELYEFDGDNIYQAQRDQEAVDNYVGF
jgi:hypothetical protein